MTPRAERSDGAVRAGNDSALSQLAARGVFSELDRHFALALGRLTGEPAEVLLAAAFASRAVQNGHVCVDLAQLATTPLYDANEEPITDVAWPELTSWLALLRRSTLVSANGDDVRPLVLDGAGRLYLYRYWKYQRDLARQIRERTAGLVETASVADLQAGLTRLFPHADPSFTFDAVQELAALLAAHKRFLSISGGPGTGKTHTVVKLLALLQENAIRHGGAPLRIVLVAPTGKAAARLSESMSENLARLNAGVAACIPSSASTIHRVLGYQPRTPTRFRHDAKNLLPVDVLLLDEASMVDLALLAKLLAAVPASARVILLGDKDQLASIEAGAVFGDIHAAGARRGYSAELRERVLSITGRDLPEAAREPRSSIGDSVVHLTKTHRYAADSGIARLAAAVNAGRAQDALAELPESTASSRRTQLTFEFASAAQRQTSGDTALIRVIDAKQLEARLKNSVLAGYLAYCRERDVRRKLTLLTAFRILCAHRNGPFGVHALNDLVERQLRALGQLDGGGTSYEGRPVMVTRNDYQLELFNGDVGAFVREPGGTLRAYFSRPNGQLRSFLPSRLPPHETVFAMTVHKSQGSEFDHVLLVLPPEPSPIVTRELLYTAVTRARRRVEIAATPAVLRAAVETRVERASGLTDALLEEPGAREPGP